MRGKRSTLLLDYPSLDGLPGVALPVPVLLKIP
jgi:hypothetical protein